MFRNVLIALVLVALVQTAFATTCGGNCPSNDCPSCPCGTSSAVTSISSACSAYSGWSQACCQCIASKESGGNANAANYNTNGSFDIGLWQINSSNWASCSGGSAPCSVSVNRGCAQKVWGWGGNTWKYWSTCGLCKNSNGVSCCSAA